MYFTVTLLAIENTATFIVCVFQYRMLTFSFRDRFME